MVFYGGVALASYGTSREASPLSAGCCDGSLFATQGTRALKWTFGRTTRLLVFLDAAVSNPQACSWCLKSALQF